MYIMLLILLYNLSIYYYFYCNIFFEIFIQYIYFVLLFNFFIHYI